MDQKLKQDLAALADSLEQALTYVQMHLHVADKVGADIPFDPNAAVLNEARDGLKNIRFRRSHAHAAEDHAALAH